MLWRACPKKNSRSRCLTGSTWSSILWPCIFILMLGGFGTEIFVNSLAWACDPMSEHDTVARLAFSQSNTLYLIERAKTEAVFSEECTGWDLEFHDLSFQPVATITWKVERPAGYIYQPKLGKNLKVDSKLALFRKDLSKDLKSKLERLRKQLQPELQAELRKSVETNPYSKHSCGNLLFREVFQQMFDLRLLPEKKKASVTAKHEDGKLLIYYPDPELKTDLTIDNFLSEVKHDCSRPENKAFNCGDYGTETDLTRIYEGRDENLLILVRSHLSGTAFEGDLACSSTDTRDHLVFFNPKDLSYLRDNILGYRAILRKEYDSAKTLLERSVNENKLYRHANFNLACTLSLLKKSPKDSRVFLERILDQPEWHDLYLTKISTDPDLEFWRQDKDFLKWLNKVKMITEKKSKKRKALGGCQIPEAYLANEEGLKTTEQKNEGHSVIFFEKAVKLEPTCLEARFNLALFYGRKNKFSSAFENFKIAYSQNPVYTKKRFKQHQEDLQKFRDAFKDDPDMKKLFEPEKAE